MKIIIALLLTVAIVQALVPRDILIAEDKLFPKKTLKEWQEILKNAEYHPSNVSKPEIIPQPESSGRALTPRIVGGSAAASGQFPWQVAIHMDKAYFCGGSLIASTWVLTAGHCVDGITQFVILAGSLSPTSGGQSQTTTSKTLHNEYNPNTVTNDIGLLSVGKDFTIGSSTINTVLLPPSNIGSLQGVTARVSGWGKTSDTSALAKSLNFVDLEILSPSVCVSYYGSFTDKQICCSGAGHKSTCSGDSGGPMVVQGNDLRWMQVGIVSFGSINGCEAGYPLGFTRVSSYLTWIDANTGLSR